MKKKKKLNNKNKRKTLKTKNKEAEKYMSEKNNYPKYFNYFLLAGLAVLGFFVVKPFIVTLLTALVLGYISYPVYKWLSKKIKNKNISSLIITLLLLGIIIIPFVFGVSLISQESYKLYIFTKQRIYSGKLIDVDCTDNTGPACFVNKEFQLWLENPRTRFYVDDMLTKATNLIFEKASDFIVLIPKLIFFIFVMFFVLFFLFRDGDKISQVLENLLPMSSDKEHKIVARTKEVVKGTVYGSLLTSLVQGIVAGVGYFIFGLRNPILLGVLTAFAALVPFLGTGLVYVPLSLRLILEGSAGQTGALVRGLMLLGYGILVISTIDNIIKPHLVGGQAKIHPVLVLIGVFGGLAMMGLIGIVIGPLILTLLFSFLKAYKKGEMV